MIAVQSGTRNGLPSRFAINLESLDRYAKPSSNGYSCGGSDPAEGLSNKASSSREAEESVGHIDERKFEIALDMKSVNRSTSSEVVNPSSG